MKIKKETKIGFLVILSIFIMIWGIGFMKGRNFFQNSNNYYGRYSRVEGLNVGSPIYYKGFKIGTVRKIDFESGQPNEFLVTFSLTKTLPITNKTVAQLYSVDLMGSKAIQFINSEGFIFHNSVELAPGDTLRTSIMGDLKDQVSTEVLPLKDKVENLIVRFDSVLTNIGGIFTHDNKENLNKSIKSFYATFASLEKSAMMLQATLSQGGELHSSFENIESFTEGLNMQNENLMGITTNFKNFSAKLNEADVEGIIASMDSAVININQTLEKINSQDGTIGLLLDDKTLYLNLNDAAANMDRLLADIRHNPERYINFSAVNLGKKMYIYPDANSAKNQGIIFKVKISESKIPINSLKNKELIDDLIIREDYDGKKYVYTVGETHSYEEALKISNKIYNLYPSATIIALQKGAQITLNKALKKVNN